MILIDKDLLDFSFSHNVYLLLCKRSERTDEPMSMREANNSVISNVLIIKKNEFGLFSYNNTFSNRENLRKSAKAIIYLR